MNCETNIDDCVNQDCNGLGTCIDGVNSFSCNCDPPFTGLLCERINYCYGVNCNRNGLAVLTNILFSLVIAILDSLENCVVWIAIKQYVHYIVRS